MNKKDLSAFRSQFKLDSYQLSLKQLYTAYLKKDNQQVLYAECASFDSKSESEQEIYLSSFKKLLTGGLNEKVFELPFDDDAPEGEGQQQFCTLLESMNEAFVACCDAYISKIAANFTYESDIVLTFASGKYSKPTGKKGRKGEETSLDGIDDTSFGYQFIVCSLCKAEPAKRGLYYSAAAEKLELNSLLDKTIFTAAPLEGFVFPSFGDHGSDINKVVYYTAKANLRNESFMTNVLHCKYEPTAKEEQEKFEEILRLVNGEKIKPEILKNIYEAVHETVEACEDSGEPVTLDVKALRTIFEESGVHNLSGFEDAYHQAADKGFEFKASSLASSGPVKISCGVAEIAVNLEDLTAVKQVVNTRGRKCLQIELSEDAELNGMFLETETI